jgi:hypothetical protein
LRLLKASEQLYSADGDFVNFDPTVSGTPSSGESVNAMARHNPIAGAPGGVLNTACFYWRL